MRPLCKASEAIPYKIGCGTIPALVNKTGDWRFTTPLRRDKISPCTAACPLHNGIAFWMDKIRDGDFAGAWSVLSGYNPFPAITGHVCYHYCESECSRGGYDEAVAISELEKQVGLWRQQAQPRNGANHSVNRPAYRAAVVGSGPAGLACAYYLTMLGVQVTVYEKQPVAGGLLALGIPEYRLPRDILGKELMMLEALGVRFQMNTELGRDITLDQLQETSDTVFLATGASREKSLAVPGEGLTGVMGALAYLRAVHLGKDVPSPRSVVVIGGGNAAIDAACVARLRGSRVVVAYRRAKEAMPAHAEEVGAAQEAGVQFLFQVAPVEIAGGTGVEQLRLVRTEAVRRGENVKIVPNSSFTLDCDLLLVATGQEPELSFSHDLLRVSGESVMTSVGGIFAGGDVTTGPANVAAAIAAGREGARAIARYLEIEQNNEPVPVIAPPFAQTAPIVEYTSLNPFIYPKEGRSACPETEAGRCLSCGHCNRCGVCWAFCPDLAVAEEGNEYQFLLDYCKGCGICVKECPGGVLEMEVGTGGADDHHR
jgi:NADPH-dependent glutamate synthase beta subunit-like oxidoreductase/Pyruvate/2-oxoacid:ferredoxin oxidoreductase delta subunit